jgi:uncharacterized membrane protein
MRKLLIVEIIACGGMMFAPAAVISEPAGPPGGIDVNLVNPLPVPVTVEGDASVTGDVNVTNTPDVNVTNTPDVNVVNDATNPISVKINASDIPQRITSDYMFTGVTSALYDGNLGGIVGAANKCRSEFGSTARMCTTKDIVLFPPNVTSIESSQVVAWIQPVPIDLISVGDSPSVVFLMDYSGLISPIAGENYIHSDENFTCNQWTSNDDESATSSEIGTTMRIAPLPGIPESGGIGPINQAPANANCAYNLPISCCAPTPVE